MSFLKQIAFLNKKVILLCLLFLFSKADRALAQQLVCDHVSVPELPDFKIITGITQDPKGYMWFTAFSVGVLRFDGYHLVRYSHDSLDPGSLASDWVTSVYADHNGFIWVGTDTTGLDRLDPETGRFTHFPHDPKKPGSLSHERVNAIWETKDGTIWVGTMNGLDRWDPKTGNFTNYRNHPNDPGSLSNNNVSVLYEDKKGTLWVGTGCYNDKDTATSHRGGLNRMDRKTGKFTRYMHNPKDSFSLINDLVGAIFEDSKGNFWINTAGDGLHLMDREKGRFQRLCYDSTHPEKLSGPPMKRNTNNQDLDLFFVQEDGAGAIWIGSSGASITRYDPRTKKATHYDAFNNDGHAMHEVAGAFTSREGVLWLPTWSGHIYRFDPFRGSISHSSVHGIVKSIYEEVSGELWVGTLGDGLYKTDKYKRSLGRFAAGSANANKLNYASIDALCEGENNSIWIGINKSLYRYNKKTQSLLLYLSNPQDKNGYHARIDDILQDQPGSLWFTRFKVGLEHLDTRSGLLTHYRNDPKDNKSLSHNDVTCLFKDHSGNIWVGTCSGTLNVLNPATREFKHFPCSGRIGSIVEDFENCIWVGTTTGLYRSNPAKTAFSLFTNPRIPHAPAFMVAGLLEDDQNNLWLSSPEGIFRISPTRSEVSLYSGNRGVIAINFAHDLLRGRKGRQGELYFADRTGYYTVLPDKFRTNTVPPQIVISAFSVLDQPVYPGKGSPLRHPLSKTKEIRLSHDQNVFSFDVVGIHYSSPEDNQLFFMLENLDNTWRRAGSERKAYYYNVPPGSYVFRVKAANCDGVWAEKHIAIIISPPWWQTWWFRITAALLLLVLFYSAIRWSVHRKFRVQLERSEKEKLLADLRQKAGELEMQALRSQMNPHFIFNSLNSINQFILQNDKAQASEYLTKFSRLVRLILQNSQASLIPLESELEALQLYLELEALRFNDHFDFTISVEEDLDVGILKVPPLIIQPYAENAIWHGLMHKKERGHLEIELSQVDDRLYCTITDDGIGRKRAAELKSKSGQSHKSMGMRITADRIALLQQQRLIHASMQVNDLVLPDGSAGGTEVILKLPIRYD